MTKNNNLVLELISDPEIIRHTHLNNSEAWRSKLTKEQYADREWTIGIESNLGKRKQDEPLGVYHYVLRDLSIPVVNKFDNIVASLETLNRRAWRIDGKDGELKQIYSACIGGVFTLAQHRKKGHAAVMINLLNEEVDKQLGKDGFTFLYSEVGEYYSKFGYESFEVPVHSFNAKDTQISSKNSKSEYHNLKYDDYAKLVEVQEKTIKKALIEESHKTDKTLVTLVPDIDIYSWFHDRDIFISKILRPDVKVEHFGVVLNDSNDHIIWLHDWNSETLVIVKIYNENQHEIKSFEKLISIAIEEAQFYNFKKISIWDSSLGESKEHHEKALKLIESFADAKTFQSNSSMSAIRLHDKTPKSEISWENNDKWCWF